MIWRYTYAMLLAIAGSIGCIVTTLPAWESVIVLRSKEIPSPQSGGGVGGGVTQLSLQSGPSRERDVSSPHLQLSNREPILLELSPPLGLPSVPFPQDNSPTRERIDLGRQLFFDPSLSSDQSTSCASCHNPKHAFADNEVNSRGIDRKKGNRNTPTVINAAFQPYQFWDGRASSLEDQALLPLENPLEMGSSVSNIVDRLNQLPRYRDAFHRAFGSPVTRQNLAQALASFERTVLAGDSDYDRYVAGNPTALSQKAAEGMKLFQGKAHCHLCHQGYNFSDGLFHNLGVGWGGNGFADEGRSAVTGIVKDRGSFKTPTLRQVAQTAPYMHDGSMASLEAVVTFYDEAGSPIPILIR